jgi:hypothetical protein
MELSKWEVMILRKLIPCERDNELVVG